MRIIVNIEKIDSPTCKALTNFLNFHLTEKNHSITFQGMFFDFVEKPKKNKKFKCKMLYGKWADFSLPIELENSSELNLADFNILFQAVKSNISLVKRIELHAKYTYDFNEELLFNDLNQIELPNKTEDLVKWYDEKGNLKNHLALKQRTCRLIQRKKIKIPYEKKLKSFRAYPKFKLLDKSANGNTSPDNEVNNNLQFYFNFLVDKLNKKIKKTNFYSAQYSQIYFSISDSLENAIEFPLEDWYEYQIIELNYKHFCALTIKERIKVLSKSLSSALVAICDIDVMCEISILDFVKDYEAHIIQFIENLSDNEIIEILESEYNHGEKILLNRKVYNE